MVTSLEGIVLYYLSVSEMWPNNKGWWEWPYNKGGLWLEWPYKRGGLWLEWPYKRGTTVQGRVYVALRCLYLIWHCVSSRGIGHPVLIFHYSRQSRNMKVLLILYVLPLYHQNNHTLLSYFVALFYI